MKEKIHPRIRTVTQRDGRTTRAQKRALKELLPQYRVPDQPAVIDFRDTFPSARKIAVEVGFGNGALLLEMASSSPDTGYLGIEVYRSGIGRLLMGANERLLSNIRIADQDARDVLCDRIAPGSVDELYVMFPDPWPKKRHFKRRLMQPEFAAACANILTAAGRLYFATDWEDYAHHSLEVLESTTGLRNTAADGYSLRPTRVSTRFEQRAQLDGRAVFDLVFEKTAL